MRGGGLQREGVGQRELVGYGEWQRIKWWLSDKLEVCDGHVVDSLGIVYPLQSTERAGGRETVSVQV